MSSRTAGRIRPPKVRLGALAGIVGFLAFVEFTSGILQGYYVPLFSDIVVSLGIHDSDVNWFEAAQLLLSALVVLAAHLITDILYALADPTIQLK